MAQRSDDGLPFHILKLLEDADANGDGRISWSEFQTFAQKNLRQIPDSAVFDLWLQFGGDNNRAGSFDLKSAKRKILGEKVSGSDIIQDDSGFERANTFDFTNTSRVSRTQSQTTPKTLKYTLSPVTRRHSTADVHELESINSILQRQEKLRQHEMKDIKLLFARYESNQKGRIHRTDLENLILSLYPSATSEDIQALKLLNKEGELEYDNSSMEGLQMYIAHIQKEFSRTPNQDEFIQYLHDNFTVQETTDNSLYVDLSKAFKNPREFAAALKDTMDDVLYSGSLENTKRCMQALWSWIENHGLRILQEAQNTQQRYEEMKYNFEIMAQDKKFFDDQQDQFRQAQELWMNCQKEHAELQETFKVTQAEKEHLQQRLETITQEFEILQHECKKKDEEVKSFRADLENLRQVNAAALKHIKMLQEQQENSQFVTMAKTQELQKAQTNIQEENVRLKQENQTLRSMTTAETAAPIRSATFRPSPSPSPQGKTSSIPTINFREHPSPAGNGGRNRTMSEFTLPEHNLEDDLITSDTRYSVEEVTRSPTPPRENSTDIKNNIPDLEDKINLLLANVTTMRHNIKSLEEMAPTIRAFNETLQKPSIYDDNEPRDESNNYSDSLAVQMQEMFKYMKEHLLTKEEHKQSSEEVMKAAKDANVMTTTAMQENIANKNDNIEKERQIAQIKELQQSMEVIIKNKEELQNILTEIKMMQTTSNEQTSKTQTLQQESLRKIQDTVKATSEQLSQILAKQNAEKDLTHRISQLELAALQRPLMPSQSVSTNQSETQNNNQQDGGTKNNASSNSEWNRMALTDVASRIEELKKIIYMSVAPLSEQLEKVDQQLQQQNAELAAHWRTEDYLQQLDMANLEINSVSGTKTWNEYEKQIRQGQQANLEAARVLQEEITPDASTLRKSDEEKIAEATLKIGNDNEGKEKDKEREVGTEMDVVMANIKQMNHSAEIHQKEVRLLMEHNSEEVMELVREVNNVQQKIVEIDDRLKKEKITRQDSEKKQMEENKVNIEALTVKMRDLLEEMKEHSQGLMKENVNELRTELLKEKVRGETLAAQQQLLQEQYKLKQESQISSDKDKNDRNQELKIYIDYNTNSLKEQLLLLMKKMEEIKIPSTMINTDETLKTSQPLLPQQQLLLLLSKMEESQKQSKDQLIAVESNLANFVKELLNEMLSKMLHATQQSSDIQKQIAQGTHDQVTNVMDTIKLLNKKQISVEEAMQQFIREASAADSQYRQHINDNEWSKTNVGEELKKLRELFAEQMQAHEDKIRTLPEEHKETAPSEKQVFQCLETMDTRVIDVSKQCKSVETKLDGFAEKLLSIINNIAIEKKRESTEEEDTVDKLTRIQLEQILKADIAQLSANFRGELENFEGRIIGIVNQQNQAFRNNQLNILKGLDKNFESLKLYSSETDMFNKDDSAISSVIPKMEEEKQIHSIKKIPQQQLSSNIYDNNNANSFNSGKFTTANTISGSEEENLEESGLTLANNVSQAVVQQMRESLPLLLTENLHKALEIWNRNNLPKPKENRNSLYLQFLIIFMMIYLIVMQFPEQKPDRNSMIQEIRSRT